MILTKDKTVFEACRAIDVCEQTFYRWRNEYCGLKVNQANKLKMLERENSRPMKAVVELALDKLILQEAARGNF